MTDKLDRKLITGDDIMKAFGIPPCKLIGEIKTVIKDAILDGDIQNDREQAWQLMIETGRKLGAEPVAGMERKGNAATPSGSEIYFGICSVGLRPTAIFCHPFGMDHTS